MFSSPSIQFSQFGTIDNFRLQRIKVRSSMKQLLLIVCCLLFPGSSLAQTPETFDIATYQPPKSWHRQASQNAIQFSTEDKARGTYCQITLLKSLPGTSNSKENFDAAWQTVVKGMVNVSGAPQMQTPANENGWEALSGFAPFENDGNKGIAMLVTISGFSRMVNVVILTNTDAYQQNISDFLESASLKKPVGEIGTTTTRNAISPSSQTALPPPAAASGYAFTTTKFDDGWTSTVQEDWVHVAKGNIRVLIHYPNKSADAYNSVVMDGLKNAWNVLVAPRYSTAGNFEFRPITGWQAIEFAEADAVEKATGNTVHVVLFKMNYANGGGRYLEFITLNKSSFEQEFGAYHATTSGWGKMENMANYNKFGIAAADLKGKWTNDFSGSLSYVNAYTGASAGTDTHASVENFLFGPGNTYKWDLGVASGAVGNIKFQGVKSSGRVSVPGIWQVTLSDIEGKPRTFNAYFSCVKGARILWLDGKAYGKLD